MNRPRFGSAILATGGLLVADSVIAHPGHGLFEQGPAHAFNSPFHLLVLALLGAGCLLGAKLVRSPKMQQLMRFAAAAVVLLSVLIWTLHR